MSCDPIDQMCHGDIPSTADVNVKQKGSKFRNITVSVPKNPHLAGKLKVLSVITVIVPLTPDGRTVYFVNGINHLKSQKKSMCVVFLGDTPHGGGVTYHYHKETPLKTYPSFHTYTLHP